MNSELRNNGNRKITYGINNSFSNNPTSNAYDVDTIGYNDEILEPRRNFNRHNNYSSTPVRNKPFSNYKQANHYPHVVNNMSNQNVVNKSMPRQFDLNNDFEIKPDISQQFDLNNNFEFEPLPDISNDSFSSYDNVLELPDNNIRYSKDNIDNHNLKYFNDHSLNHENFSNDFNSARQLNPQDIIEYNNSFTDYVPSFQENEFDNYSNSFANSYEPEMNYYGDILEAPYYDDEPVYDDESLYDDEYEQNNNKPHRKSKKKKIIISVLASLLLITSGVGVFAYKMLHGVQTGYEKADEKSISVETKKGYTTIALFGADASFDRADTIIIANINEANGEVKMVSVARDMFAYVNGWQDYQVSIGTNKNQVCDYTKINGSFCMNKQRGEPTPNRMVETLNENLGLGIRHYLAVNFDSVAELVDAVDGVEVTLPDKDNFIWTMNRFGWEAAYDAGIEYTDVPEDARGKTVKLNGYQALGYCRVRKTAENHPERPLKGESDFTRSERQKDVVNKVFQKIKSGGVTTLLHVTDVFKNNKNFRTSYEMTDLISLAKEAISKGYHIVEDDENKISIPTSPHEVMMWHNKNGKGGSSTQFAQTNLYEDARILHDYLYNNEEVDITKYKKVMQISDQLEKDEKQYGTKGTFITKMCLDSQGNPDPNTTKWPPDNTANANAATNNNANQNSTSKNANQKNKANTNTANTTNSKKNTTNNTKKNTKKGTTKKKTQ